MFKVGHLAYGSWNTLKGQPIVCISNLNVVCTNPPSHTNGVHIHVHVNCIIIICLHMNYIPVCICMHGAGIQSTNDFTIGNCRILNLSISMQYYTFIAMRMYQ